MITFRKIKTQEMVDNRVKRNFYVNPALLLFVLIVTALLIAPSKDAQYVDDISQE